MKNLLIFICCIPFFIAHGEGLSWKKGINHLSISKTVSILEDKSGQLNFNTVSGLAYQSKFTPSNSTNLVLGYTTSIFWLKFSFENTTSEELVLEIEQAGLPICDLYYLDQNNKLVQYKAGSNTAFSQRIFKNSFQVFPLDSGKKDYYIRLTSNSGPIPFNVYSKSYYETKSIKQKFVYGIYLGLMLFVVLSNLFFGYSLKNKLYIANAFLVLIFICFSMVVVDGFVVYFFEKVDMLFWYTFFPPFGTTLLMIYSVSFLEVKQYTPNFFKIVLWIIIGCAVWFLIKFFLPFNIVQPINTLQALITMVTLGLMGYKVYNKGNKVGLYFVFTYIVYFLMVLTEATYVNTGKPTYIFGFSYSGYATVVEALALYFMLTQRFEWEREEAEKSKQEMQNQLIEKTKENERIVINQNITLENKVNERTAELKESLENLKMAQAQLVQSEKLASLGELTAGIAHEIQNPLNFVNNFSEVSAELVKELEDELVKGDTEEAKAIAGDLRQNLQKIQHHGGRASSIVRGMIEHSRLRTGEKQSINLNQLADEYLRLAYQGQRAKDKTFNCQLITDLKYTPSTISVVPQDIGRVLLNLYNNAFYAVHQQQKHQSAGSSYIPTVWVNIKLIAQGVQIRVGDNGTGIPETIREKIFQPFFTTKPTGEGTGLGLSLSYDIITKGHGGTIDVFSHKGKGTEFVVVLPTA